jgi:L-threonylcarbamoyladenylate synthase
VSPPLATLVPVDPVAPDPIVMARMGAALRAGELVAFPTETVYGLGANATDARAVAQIFAAKGRPSSDPLIVHIATLAQLPLVTGRTLAALPAAVAPLAARFWPGPLTLILPRGPLIPPEVAAGRDTVGVRLPAHPVALALIRAAGVPVAAPSANRFGHTSPTTAQHVFADLGTRIPWILDGGPSQVGVESTILDLTQTPPRILRPGGVPLEAIAGALGTPVAFLERAAVAQTEALAPGMALSHYAPQARLLLFDGDDIAATWARALAETQALAAQGRRVGALAPDDLTVQFTQAGAMAVAPLGAEGDLAATAQRLFAALRQLDDAGAEVIVCGAFPRAGLGAALRDRLWRAAGGTVIAITAD